MVCLRTISVDTLHKGDTDDDDDDDDNNNNNNMCLSFSDYSYYNPDWKLVYTLIPFSVGLTTAGYVTVQWLTLYVVNCTSLNTVITPIKFYDIVSELIILYNDVQS